MMTFPHHLANRLCFPDLLYALIRIWSYQLLGGKHLFFVHSRATKKGAVKLPLFFDLRLGGERPAADVAMFGRIG
jgi:hypothetical protein